MDVYSGRLAVVAESVEVKKRGEQESEKEGEGHVKDLLKSQKIGTEGRKLQEQVPEEFSWVRDIRITFAQPLTLSHKCLDETHPSTTISPYYHISPPSLIALQPYDITTEKFDSEIKGITTTIAELYEALRKIPSVEFGKPKELIPITPEADLVPPSTSGSFKDLSRFIPGLCLISFRNVPEVNMSLELDSSFTARKVSVIDKIKVAPEPEEAASILDMLFDIDEETRKGLIHILYDRPRVIVACKPPSAELSYIELLKRLLREIYRVCAEGLPRPRHISKDLTEVELDISADRSVYVLADDSPQASESRIRDRLRELFSQRYGFLVLYGMEEKFTVKPGEDYPYPITLKLVDRSKDHLMRVVKAFYGFVRETPLETGSLDLYTVLLEEHFYSEIRKLLSDVKMVLATEPSSEDEEGTGYESALHFALKVFCVKYFIEKGIKTVETEVDVPTVGRVDVLVREGRPSSLAVEIETLYDTGLPIIKLKKTIESRLKSGLDLWIVVPPMQTFIYLNELLILRRLYREAYGERLELYTTDFGSGTLITLGDFINRVRQLQ